ncbi:GerAB/ArcD/ProY family transporter [Alkalihalobacillus deserti]|uniref:GerAB/ArcD/ProY family transporter n=1 Tax=Alkalihalobacillus deserti TaxID=2879466 RepID=UPI001D14B202|nr:endospore germination permease [Alkalihalobacillus deserti]
MEFPKKITAIQTAIITASSIIGTGMLTIARRAVEFGDTSGPLLTIFGTLVAFIAVWIICQLGKKFSGKSIFQYSEEIIGKWLARFFSVLIIWYLVVLTAFNAREFGEVVKTTVLHETPLEVMVLATLVLVAISVRNNITTFAYIHHFYFPLIFAPALLISIFSLKHANVLYLQPVMGNAPTNPMAGILLVAAMFQLSFILTIVIPAMRETQQALKAATWGVIFSGGLYLIIVIANLAVFGSEEIKGLMWPMLELTRITTLPGEILQRLDAAFLAVWVTAVYTTIFSSYFLCIYAIKQVFHFKDHKMFSFLILPFVFFISSIPRNVLEMYDIIRVVEMVGLVITFGYPCLLLVIVWVRKRKRKKGIERSLDQHG